MMESTEARRALVEGRIQERLLAAELRRQGGRKRHPRHVFRAFLATLRP
jgi:hypothetical protein